MTSSKLHVLATVLSCCILLTSSLPASLVEEVKDNEVRNIKVKRAHDSSGVLEKSPNVPTFYSKPTAIKRDTNRNEQYQGWGNEGVYPTNGLSYVGSNEYSDAKTLADYEKAYKQAEDQVKLDEALRNAILKSEIYRESPTTPYRYYYDDQKRRKRRSAPKLKYERVKRDAELNPEDVLTVLNLLDKERQRGNPSFDNMDYSNQNYFNGMSENDDETWLDGPVYPHVSTHKNSKYYYEKPQVYGKFNQYGDVLESKSKRFKVAKRKNDPTKELRYLNGPSVNDYYTLAQLLSNQREPNVPVYHRAVL